MMSKSPSTAVPSKLNRAVKSASSSKPSFICVSPILANNVYWDILKSANSYINRTLLILKSPALYFKLHNPFCSIVQCGSIFTFGCR